MTGPGEPIIDELLIPCPKDLALDFVAAVAEQCNQCDPIFDAMAAHVRLSLASRVDRREPAPDPFRVDL